MVPIRPLRSAATSRGAVLDLIRSKGPISRVELAESTGLTQATMSNVVRQLLIDGLVIDSGRGESTGGKPRVLLSINPTARFGIGIQVGADSLTYVVTDLNGEVVGRTRTRGVHRSEPEIAIDLIGLAVHTLLLDLGIAEERVVGIGLVAPGPLDLEAGTILAPPTLDEWVNFPIRDRLGAATGLPVVLDNDATAAAIGEYWGGAVAGAAAHCSVYMGAGIGAGIVFHGSVYRGASSNAGELGQVWIETLGAATPRSTVEQLAGPAGVAARARAAIAAGRAASFALSGDADPFGDFAVISTAAVHGDPLALELVNESARYLAGAVVSMANILDLDSIVLCGPSFAIAGSLYLIAVRDRMAQDFFARTRHSVRISLSAQMSDAAAVGGAALVLQQKLSPRAIGYAPRISVRS